MRAKARGSASPTEARQGALEAPLAGVRLFLAQDPAPTAPRSEDYEAWAREFNENPPDGYARVSETPGTSHPCSGSDGTTSSRSRRVARSCSAQRESLSAALSEAAPLFGHRLASQMLGLSPHARHAKQPDYPRPVVRFAKNWLWLRSDIEGYRAGRRDFTHADGALQDEYADGHQVGDLLGGISGAAVRRRVEQEAWERVPPPTGKAGKQWYWSRPVVQRWLQEQPRRLGPLSGPRRKSVS